MTHELYHSQSLQAAQIYELSLEMQQDPRKSRVLDDTLSHPFNKKNLSTFENMRKGWLNHLLSPSTVVNRVLITGFSGSGKSTLEGELLYWLIGEYHKNISLLQQGKGLEITPEGYAYIPPEQPKIYTIGLAKAIKLCRDTNDIKSTTAQGEITPEQYNLVAERLAAIRELAIFSLDGGILFEDGVAESEGFDRGLQSIGVARTSWPNLQQLAVKTTSKLDILAIYANLETLESRVGFREVMISGGPDKLMELQRQKGIIEDRKPRSPKELQEIFVKTYLRTGNLQTLTQQLSDWYAVYQKAAEANLLTQRCVPPKTWEKYRKQVLKKNPQDFLDDLSFGFYNSYMFRHLTNNYATTLYNPNPTIMEDFEYFEFRGLVDALDVLPILAKKAAASNSKFFKRRVIDLGIKLP